METCWVQQAHSYILETSKKSLTNKTRGVNRVHSRGQGEKGGVFSIQRLFSFSSEKLRGQLKRGEKIRKGGEE